MEKQLIQSVSLSKERILSLVIGNILDEPVDCIVNAANGMLAHGGGVAAAIAKAAGVDLVKEGNRIIEERGEIPVGEAVVTTAGNLPYRGVIHAVGPRKGQGEEESKLVQTLQSAFLRATEKGWQSLSFPAVSSGIFAVPLEVCARAYIRAVREFFQDHPDSSLQIVRLCLFKGPLVDAVIEEIEKQGLL